MKKSTNEKNKAAPFLIPGFGEYFDKNPYFIADIKSTYKKTSKEKFIGKPFLPPSTTKYVSHVSVVLNHSSFYMKIIFGF